LVVTHPFHPLFGRRLEVLYVRREAAGRVYVCDGGGGRNVALDEALHGPYAYLAVYADGRSRTIYVPQAVEEAAAAHVELTQRNEALLAEISQINLELLRRRALE
jgi:Family of unknown function (DUF5372)